MTRKGAERSYRVRTEDGVVQEMSQQEMSEMVRRSMERAKGWNGNSASVSAIASDGPGASLSLTSSTMTTPKTTTSLQQQQQQQKRFHFGSPSSRQQSSSSSYHNNYHKHRHLEYRDDINDGGGGGGGLLPNMQSYSDHHQKHNHYHLSSTSLRAAGGGGSVTLSRDPPESPAHEQRRRRMDPETTASSQVQMEKAGTTITTKEPSLPASTTNNNGKSQPRHHHSQKHDPHGYTVVTQKDGKKVMSQAEINDLVKKSIFKARMQAACQQQQLQLQQQQQQQPAALSASVTAAAAAASRPGSRGAAQLATPLTVPSLTLSTAPSSVPVGLQPDPSKNQDDDESHKDNDDDGNNHPPRSLSSSSSSSSKSRHSQKQQRRELTTPSPIVVESASSSEYRREPLSQSGTRTPPDDNVVVDDDDNNNKKQKTALRARSNNDSHQQHHRKYVNSVNHPYEVVDLADYHHDNNHDDDNDLDPHWDAPAQLPASSLRSASQSMQPSRPQLSVTVPSPGSAATIMALRSISDSLRLAEDTLHQPPDDDNSLVNSEAYQAALSQEVLAKVDHAARLWLANAQLQQQQQQQQEDSSKRSQSESERQHHNYDHDGDGEDDNDQVDLGLDPVESIREMQRTPKQVTDLTQVPTHQESDHDSAAAHSRQRLTPEYLMGGVEEALSRDNAEARINLMMQKQPSKQPRHATPEFCMMGQDGQHPSGDGEYNGHDSNNSSLAIKKEESSALATAKIAKARASKPISSEANALIKAADLKRILNDRGTPHSSGTENDPFVITEPVSVDDLDEASKCAAITSKSPLAVRSNSSPICIGRIEEDSEFEDLSERISAATPFASGSKVETDEESSSRHYRKKNVVPEKENESHDEKEDDKGKGTDVKTECTDAEDQPYSKQESSRRSDREPNGIGPRWSQDSGTVSRQSSPTMTTESGPVEKVPRSYDQDSNRSDTTKNAPQSKEFGATHSDIEEIVQTSIDKAQQSAREQVKEIIKDSKKREHGRLEICSSDGVQAYLAQQELLEVVEESMRRAKSSAQDEIANLVKDSMRMARESAQEEIRVLVEQAMRRARETTAQEVTDIVREAFQRAREESDTASRSLRTSSTLSTTGTNDNSRGRGKPSSRSRENSITRTNRSRENSVTRTPSGNADRNGLAKIKESPALKQGSPDSDSSIQRQSANGLRVLVENDGEAVAPHAEVQSPESDPIERSRRGVVEGESKGQEKTADTSEAKLFTTMGKSPPLPEAGKSNRTTARDSKRFERGEKKPGDETGDDVAENFVLKSDAGIPLAEIGKTLESPAHSFDGNVDMTPQDEAQLRRNQTPIVVVPSIDVNGDDLQSVGEQSLTVAVKGLDPQQRKKIEQTAFSLLDYDASKEMSNPRKKKEKMHDFISYDASKEMDSPKHTTKPKNMLSINTQAIHYREKNRIQRAMSVSPMTEASVFQDNFELKKLEFGPTKLDADRVERRRATSRRLRPPTQGIDQDTDEEWQGEPFVRSDKTKPPSLRRKKAPAALGGKVPPLHSSGKSFVTSPLSPPAASIFSKVSSLSRSVDDRSHERYSVLSAEKNDSETVVTDEFLAKIASKKGTKITTKELNRMIQTTNPIQPPTISPPSMPPTAEKIPEHESEAERMPATPEPPKPALKEQTSEKRASSERRLTFSDRASVNDSKSVSSARAQQRSGFCVSLMELLHLEDLEAEPDYIEDCRGSSRASPPPRTNRPSSTSASRPNSSRSVRQAPASAFSPASVFTPASNWLDSMVEDMDSVAGGDGSSIDFETDGTTTFDENSLMSDSFSKTEYSDEGTTVVDDNSFNAGWWGSRNPGRK